jgi:hypothetical protein
MRGITRIAVAGLLAVAPVAGTVGATAAHAGDDDVIREGSCSGASDWKLKLSPENGRLEVEFEVDQNVVGDTWRVRFVHNGERFATTRATTTAPSGSFEVRRVAPNDPGTDRFRVRAVNLETGETCVGRASI